MATSPLRASSEILLRVGGEAGDITLSGVRVEDGWLYQLCEGCHDAKETLTNSVQRLAVKRKAAAEAVRSFG